MWTWSLEWAEVSAKLLVGSCPMKPEDLKRIKQYEIASTWVYRHTPSGASQNE